MKYTKKLFIILSLIIVIGFSLAGCSRDNSMSSTFPDIKSADIPDILEKSVGTTGDTYFTKFDTSDENDYNTYFSAVFKDTSADDYNELINHYQTASTGTDEDNRLLFDWGCLNVSSEDDSILIEAYIK